MAISSSTAKEFYWGVPFEISFCSTPYPVDAERRLRVGQEGGSGFGMQRFDLGQVEYTARMCFIDIYSEKGGL
jgi:hypothetical protein